MFLLAITVLLHSQPLSFPQNINKEKALLYSKIKGWENKKYGSKQFAVLRGVDTFGLPLYYTTFNNLDAASTISTSSLWSGGSLGLNLSGSSALLKNKVAIWDGGKVLSTHTELTGRILRMDSSYNTGDGSDHATHVTGTIMATGINPLAKGMAYQLSNIKTYDFDNDLPEINAAVNDGIIISNHSYGDICGWNQNGYTGEWEFWGRYNENEDYKFGYYDPTAAEYDRLMFENPNYMLVKAVGNNRNVNGPSVGQPYNRFDSNGVMSNAGPRPSGISSNNGYNTIGTGGNAKNILSIGAVNPIPNGYSKPSDVIMTAFSSWGPTDDGRIKPDLVADGNNVLSSGGYGDNYYSRYSGTSQASPSVTGSLVLLQEYYASLHNNRLMNNATLKALVIHTADEAGNSPGPDYTFGWGLMNAKKSAFLMKYSEENFNSPSKGYYMIQDSIFSTASDSFVIIPAKSGKIKATLCWTDAPGQVDYVNVLNNRTSNLTNSLFLEIKDAQNTYLPWKLDVNNPQNPATKGVNKVDNVQQVEIDNAVQGRSYIVKLGFQPLIISPVLTQKYSLIISQPYDTATLPIHFYDFKASLFGDATQLEWKIINNNSPFPMLLESSEEGTQWKTISSIPIQQNQTTYRLIPNNSTISGRVIFRIKQMQAGGGYVYSELISVTTTPKSFFSVHPNPVDQYLFIESSLPLKGSYSVSVVEPDGKIIMRRTFNNFSKKEKLSDFKSIPNGNYFLTVGNNNETLFRSRITVFHP